MIAGASPLRFSSEGVGFKREICVRTLAPVQWLGVGAPTRAARALSDCRRHAALTRALGQARPLGAGPNSLVV
jgi:hypothetical protein